MKKEMDKEQKLDYDDNAPLTSDQKVTVWAVVLVLVVLFIKIVWEWFFA